MKTRVVQAAVTGSLSILAMPGTVSATVTNSWITWDAPSSYSQTATDPNNSAATYSYATGTTGVLTLPGGSTVYVRLSGEVVNPFQGGADPDAPSGYRGPSGFSQNGTTSPTYWSTYPHTGGASAYSSANVVSLPTNGDHIGLIGNTDGIQTQTLEFFSDVGLTQATSVSNLVLLVASLGSHVFDASWTFNRDFEVLSDGAGADQYSGSLVKSNPSAGDYVLTGDEGSGAIQFTGTFSSFSWTVSAGEVWASWNLGASSIPAPSPVPGAGLAGLTTLGLAGVARRRRR